MQLPTLDIPEAEAREKLAEYEQAIQVERRAEDVAIAMGYRAAARGLQVVALPQVIEAGGYFDYGLPKIAIVRADARQCHARWSGDHLVFADGDSRGVNRGALVNQDTVRVAVRNRPEHDRKFRWSGTTVVPLVPPRHRPRRPRLSRCHILWEVEEWSPMPPRDPALLRHIRGDLWAVLSVWNLTELERHVLSQR